MADTQNLEKTPVTSNEQINQLSNRVEKLPRATANLIREDIALLRTEIVSNSSPEEITAKITALDVRIDLAEKTQKTEKEKIEKLSKEIESRLQDKIDPIQLREELNRVKEYKDPLTRQFAIQTFWGQLKKEGYDVMVANGKVIVTGSESAKAASFSLAFNDALAEKATENMTPVTLSEIQQSILIGSGERFTDFVNNAQTPGKRTEREYNNFLLTSYNITETDTKKLIEIVHRHSAMKVEEKAYLLSSLQGGMNGLDVNKTADNYIQATTAMKDTILSPEVQKVGANIPGGLPKTPAEAEKLAEKVASNPSSLSGKPLTVIALVLGTIFALGKGDFWTGLKRGFLGGIAVLVGCGIGKEWNVDICGKAGKLLKKGVDEAGKSVQGGLESLSKIGDEEGSSSRKKKGEKSKDGDDEEGDNEEKKEEEEKTTPAQKSLHDRLTSNKPLETKINAFLVDEKKKGSAGKTGNLTDYANFISGPEIQKLSIEHLLLNQNHIDSVFSLSPSLSAHIKLPDNLDPLIFKRVMRVYLTTKDTATKGTDKTQDPGVPEKEAFLGKYTINSTTAKDKSMKDVVGMIYDKEFSSVASTSPANSPSNVENVAVATSKITVKNSPQELTVKAEMDSGNSKITINFSPEVIIEREKKSTFTIANKETTGQEVRFKGMDYKMSFINNEIAFVKKV